MTEGTAQPVAPLIGDDPEAPWGRKADGTPRAKPGRRAGSPSTGPRRSRSKTAAKVDYETPVKGLLQLPAGMLAFAGMRQPVFAADAAAITIHTPNIARALDELAQERPEVAAVLDRVLQVGPYGVVIAAILPLFIQLFVNHEILPAGIMGTVKPDVLIANFMPTLERQSPNGKSDDENPTVPE